MSRVAEVAVRVAVLFTTATRKNIVFSTLCAGWVAVVAEITNCFIILFLISFFNFAKKLKILLQLLPRTMKVLWPKGYNAPPFDRAVHCCRSGENGAIMTTNPKAPACSSRTSEP